jgi:hypothetical protein
MILLNFSHPLTPDQQTQIETLLEKKLERLIEIPVQFDHQQPFRPQLRALMEVDERN